MTHKYYDVRRSIYEEKDLKSYRSFSEMKKLFKPSYLIMMLITILSLIASIVLFFINVNFVLIPMLLIVGCAIVTDLFREDSLYYSEARKEEIENNNMQYNKYIEKLSGILRQHRIDNTEKLSRLKNECIARIEGPKTKYSNINSKIYDLLIGVPLGALIASAMYADKDSAIVRIVALIFFGIFILGIVHVVKFISFYIDCIYKDKYLLKVIRELEYYGEEIFKEAKSNQDD